MAVETSTPFRRVVGTLIRGVGDGLLGTPSGIPLAGAKVVAEASIRSATSDHYIAFDPVEGITDNNAVLRNAVTGEPGLLLVVTDDPSVGVVDWTWHLTITAPTLSRPIEFDLPVPSGVGDLDLSSVVPVPVNPGEELSAWFRLSAEAQDLINSLPTRVSQVIAEDPTLVLAAAAAVAGQLDAADVVVGRPSGSEVYSAELDENGNILPFATDQNGRVYGPVRAILAEDIAGFTSVDVLHMPNVFSFRRDAAGNLIEIVYLDGRIEFPGLVLPESAESGQLLPETVEGIGYLMDISSGFRTRIVQVDRSKLLTVGSSTFGSLPWASWTGARGMTHVQAANGGILVEHMLARYGSRPLTTSAAVTIPASGGVTVPSSNVSANLFNAFSMDGKLAGVQGTISKPGSGAGSWTFTRAASGPVVEVPSGAEFTPDIAGSADGVVVLNLGKNNLSGGVTGGTTNLDDVIRWTDDAYAFAKATGKYVLMVGHFQDTNTPAVSDARARINQYNEHLRERYGGRYVDLASYVASTRIFTDLGLAPDADDLAQIALGNKPPQVSAYTAGSWPTGTVDPLHVSVPARQVVQNQITNRITDLGWV